MFFYSKHTFDDHTAIVFNKFKFKKGGNVTFEPIDSSVKNIYQYCNYVLCIIIEHIRKILYFIQRQKTN